MPRYLCMIRIHDCNNVLFGMPMTGSAISDLSIRSVYIRKLCDDIEIADANIITNTA